MEPIHTDRFVLRPLRMSDAAVLAHYRSDPETASLQSWTVPYPLERAESMIAGSLQLDGPADGEWYSLGITDPAAPDPDELLGDVAIHVGWGGRSAELGYTLAPDARGRGAATEAAAAVVDYCFAELGIQRFHAAIHPENFASAMVLERLGFIYEGTHRQAYWVGDECTDDVIYGLLPADRDAWITRPRQRPARVTLTELDSTNVDTVRALATHWSQQRFVSPMARTFADLLADGPNGTDGAGQPYVPWYRVVIADDEVVGFVLMLEPTPTHPIPYLWRFLIDRRHQRRGIGTRVLDLITNRYRQRGDQALRVQYNQGPGNPSPLYLGYGFVPTGQVVSGEIETMLRLSSDVGNPAVTEADR